MSKEKESRADNIIKAVEKVIGEKITDAAICFRTKNESTICFFGELDRQIALSVRLQRLIFDRLAEFEIEG